MPRRVGVMGGTFDPIHHGHLVAASEVQSWFDLDEVVFVPTGAPWQKADRDVAEEFVPRIVRALQDAGVTVHGDESFARQEGVAPATDEDWGTEYLALEISAAVVADVEGAIAHIRRWSTGHTEAILARDQATIRRFVAAVDSAAVLVNASTRFTDGGEFGFGAEIGISTQKLHARGPMGLPEMTSTKYVVTGDGHIR